MTTIGQQSNSPDTGYKRYDDTHPSIKYSGSWAIEKNTSYYAGTRHTSPRTSADSVISFKFIGTKIRIISHYYLGYSPNLEISIDGNKENFSLNYNSGYPVLSYEKTNLPLAEHTVTIKKITAGSYSVDFILDAIDIDSDGRLLHPDEVIDPSDLSIGKRIRCHYSAPTSGQVGSFNGLGQETYIDGINDFIPPSSSSTPNGDFYFIMVEDWNGKKRLIADRNVQTSISWDTLNSSGIASGSGLPINLLGTEYETVIRLLTGGTSSPDKDNEWDRYIVNSNLNGTITAGDNNVWNYNIPNFQSWTSTTVASSSRTTRGYNDISAFNYPESNLTRTSEGFRPVLEIESIFVIKNYSLIYENEQYKTWNGSSWEIISDQLPEPDEFVTQGISDLTVIPAEDWSLLEDDFDIITYTNLLERNQSVHIVAEPLGQFIVSETDFSLFDDLTITAISDDVNLLRIVVSSDSGQTWKAFNGSWEISEPRNGMTVDAFNALTKDEWKLLGRTIRLAYYFEKESSVNKIDMVPTPVSTETPTLDSIKIVYNDWTIEGRMKDLERINIINMAKLQFKANALLKSSTYKLHDLVVDTFEEDSMSIVESTSTQMITKSFTAPVELEDGYYSEVSLEEFKLIKGIMIS